MLTRCVVAFALLAALTATATAQPKAALPKYALLVGCTSYPKHPDLKMLYGPENDVKLWHQTLTKGFGFPEANITRLVGWDNQPDATKPTLANIKAAFEKLIEKAEPGAHIVISLSGHGLQVPLPPDANPLDPDNFEPDGLDEVFLPADAAKADANGQIPNSLKDNDIGKYLDRLRDKGAHVLVVFDCCHSGTMTRGGPNARVVTRAARPDEVGIKTEQIADSVARAKKAVATEEAKTGKPVTEPANVKPVGDKAEKKGSLVAFYGAQPFEEAPEMPLPEDKPLAREFFHGLLTFTLNTTLQQRQAPLTYGDLANIMASQYRGIVGVKGPVPYAEGDIDREVLGYNVWPKSDDIVLTKGKDTMTISAGALRGVTTGSVLAIHPPANATGDPKAVIGYVKVTDTNVASATVELTGFDGKPAVKAETIPDLARCVIAARDYGDMRVKVFVEAHPGLKAALGALAQTENGKEVLAMLRQVEKEADADWVLRMVTPQQAAQEFGFKEVTENQVFLIRAAGREASAADQKAADAARTATGTKALRRVYSDYTLGAAATDGKAAAELAGFFARDLPKLFRWQNLWRVAGDTANAQGNSYGVKFDIVRQPGQKAKGPGEPVRGALPNKSVIDFRVKNEGQQNLWLVAVYLSPELEIAIYDVVQLEAGKSTELKRGVAAAEPGPGKTPPSGTAGVVLFLLPQSEFANKPNFNFLTQTKLRVTSRGERKDDVAGAPKTPFGKLLQSSVLAPGTRSLTAVTETTPGVVAVSWTIVP